MLKESSHDGERQEKDERRYRKFESLDDGRMLCEVPQHSSVDKVIVITARQDRPELSRQGHVEIRRVRIACDCGEAGETGSQASYFSPLMTLWIMTTNLPNMIKQRVESEMTGKDKARGVFANFEETALWQSVKYLNPSSFGGIKDR